MTDEQKGYRQALSDLRSRHRWQLGACPGDVRTMQAHEQAIAYLDMLIVMQRLHAAQDEEERRRARPTGEA